MLSEVFEHRLFHADPHPGNLFFVEPDRIGWVDFGKVGHLSDDVALSLARLLQAIIHKDVEVALDAFRSLGVIEGSVDQGLLKADLLDFITRYHGLPLEALNTELLLQDALRIVRRHEILLPPDLALLIRTLIVAAGTGRQLNPQFDLMTEAEPFIRKFMLGSVHPWTQARRLTSLVTGYSRVLRKLPDDLDEILAKLRRGKATIALRHRGLDRFILEMDRASNRLTFGMIVASLVVGSSLVMQLERGPTVLGFSALGLTGYLIAALLGLWLTVAILRSGRL